MATSEAGGSFNKVLAIELCELYDRICCEHELAVKGGSAASNGSDVGSECGESTGRVPKISLHAVGDALSAKLSQEFTLQRSVGDDDCDEQATEGEEAISVRRPATPPRRPAPPSTTPPCTDMPPLPSAVEEKSGDAATEKKQRKKVCWAGEGDGNPSRPPRSVTAPDLDGKIAGSNLFVMGRHSMESDSNVLQVIPAPAKGKTKTSLTLSPALSSARCRASGSMEDLSVSPRASMLSSPAASPRSSLLRPSPSTNSNSLQAEAAIARSSSLRGHMKADMDRHASVAFNDKIEISESQHTIRLSSHSCRSNAGHFEVLRSWRLDGDSSKRRRTPPIKSGTGLMAWDDDKADDDDEEVRQTPGRISVRFTKRQRKILRNIKVMPNSKRHSIRELCALILLVYDCVTIPMELFDMGESAFFIMMSWVVRLFWTSDLFLSFITGYVDKNGDVEMRLNYIAKRYIRTWFPLDLLVVMFNWLEVSISVSLGGSTPKILRFGRIMRLLRAAKASFLSRMISERFRSEKVRVSFHVGSILICVLVIAHFIACLWYAVGSKENTSSNWVTVYGVRDSTVLRKYLTSFHWSLTQFAGPDMEVSPQNNAERLFTVIVLIFCYVVSASFVSSITTSMTRLELLAEHQTQQFVALRRYLDENQISDKLAARVKRNAQHALTERSRNQREEEVELLQMVSEPLRVELHFEIYEPIFSAHPLLSRYQEASPAGIRKLCHTSVQIMNLSEGDVLFSDFEFPEVPRMYFITRGRMQYIQDGVGATTLKQGDWCSEASLWTHWMHVGLMRALSNVRVLTLDRDMCIVAMAQFRTRTFRPDAFAAKFVESLNQCQDLSDLYDESMDWNGMLTAAFPDINDWLSRATTTTLNRTTTNEEDAGSKYE